ncbi:MAG: type II toxin-antitoxin system RelE/ParE family toxin [Terriglobia bacterium]|jgi:mRNA interferase RelE/StbE
MANVEYAITFARSARKELESLDRPLVNRIFPVIESLAQNPRPAKCKKLSGVQNRWRIRIGDYRVVYQIFDDERVVDIVAVRHRREAYR